MCSIGGDVHPDPADCPDSIVAVFRGEYGLRVHDGGSHTSASTFVLGVAQLYDEGGRPLDSEPGSDE